MRETKIESFPDKNLGKRLNVWELKQICKKREVMGGRGGGKVCATSLREDRSLEDPSGLALAPRIHPLLAAPLPHLGSAGGRLCRVTPPNCPCKC